MSDPVIRRVRRSIDEAKNRGGMQAGMPKVTIDAGDAERLCIVAEALTTTKAENEALREGMRKVNATAERHEREMYLAKDEAEALRTRVEELERDNAHQRERRNAARDCIQKMKEESFRKQAEAVDEAREHMLRDAARGTGMNVDDANAWLKVKVQWLRDEAERAGGEK